MRRVRGAAAALLTLALSAGAIAPAMAQSPGEATPPKMQPIGKPGAQPAAPRNAAAPQPLPATAARHEPDIAYGAYQRGYYVTAFAEATQRVEQLNDVKAMTLLGELYSNGFGIKRDDNKAAEWYSIAAERGDREAMFALAMLHFSGRIKPASREEGAKLLATAAKLGQATAAYDLGLIYIEGQLFPQDFAPAAALFRSAAQVGSPEAQYALATLYKEGRGVPKDVVEAARLLAAASSADNTDAQLEYAIALFNGTGVAKNEHLAAILLAKAARKGNPVAQNRLANVLAVGRGAQANPVQAIKWHIIAKAGGVSDIPLGAFVQQQPPDIRAAGEKAAKPWVDALKEALQSRS